MRAGNSGNTNVNINVETGTQALKDQNLSEEKKSNSIRARANIENPKNKHKTNNSNRKRKRNKPKRETLIIPDKYKVPPLITDDDILAWRQARRQNWPTEARMKKKAAKKARLEARIKAHKMAKMPKITVMEKEREAVEEDAEKRCDEPKENKLKKEKDEQHDIKEGLSAIANAYGDSSSDEEKVKEHSTDEETSKISEEAINDLNKSHTTIFLDQVADQVINSDNKPTAKNPEKKKKKKKKKPRPCAFFLHGTCSKGDDCLYSHSREGLRNCPFFLKGKCRKGMRCTFLHDQEAQEEALKNPKPNIGNAKNFIKKMNAKAARVARKSVLHKLLKETPGARGKGSFQDMFNVLLHNKTRFHNKDLLALEPRGPSPEFDRKKPLVQIISSIDVEGEEQDADDEA